MRFIVSQFVDMYYLTVEGINATNNIFTSGLQLSYFIGQCIVAACTRIVEILYAALQLTFSVTSILYEDYCFFVVDFISKVKWIFSGFNYIIFRIWTCVQQFLATLKNLFEYVGYCFHANLEFLVTIVGKGGSSLYYTVETIKQALIFTGSSIWNFVSVVPVGIIYTITLSLHFIKEGVLELYLTVSNVGLAILNSVHKLVLFFSDIPVEAAFGLFLGLIAFCLVMKHFNGLIRLSVDVIVSICCCRAINGLWILVKDFLSPLFPNRRDSDAVWEFSQERQVPVEPCSSSACTVRCCDHEHERASKLCIVCQDKEKSVIILPCRHVCLCTVCCTIIQEEYGACPVCRQRVERTMTVYM
ncbi:Uncharacterized protein GBIM_15423 [Gryllus bimaculatus]|nr:Uncharacterized protein GBIM_15423 [Gryllus bimaculatus]